MNFKQSSFLSPLLFVCLLLSCSDSQKKEESHSGKKISRYSDSQLTTLPPLHKRAIESYPWEDQREEQRREQCKGNLRITKEHFRCKGDLLNPGIMAERAGKKEPVIDCGGTSSHSLPLKEGKEFIYPILLSLLNHIQAQTGKKVLITSGHRCPAHNAYVDPSKENLYSKHQIGAEVSFYVEDEEAENLIPLLIDYYKNDPREDRRRFLRYEKNDTNVSTQPWYNQEVFIKLFKSHEGRNFDNSHSYPYIAIQVRYDRDLQERVVYSWDKSYKNYFRK